MGDLRTRPTYLFTGACFADTSFFFVGLMVLREGGGLMVLSYSLTGQEGDGKVESGK